MLLFASASKNSRTGFGRSTPIGPVVPANAHQRHVSFPFYKHRDIPIAMESSSHKSCDAGTRGGDDDGDAAQGLGTGRLQSQSTKTEASMAAPMRTAAAAQALAAVSGNAPAGQPSNPHDVARAPDSQPGTQPWSNVPLDELRSRLAEFSRERNWDQYHTPRNLLLALVGETGELSELFQWRPEAEAGPGLPGFSAGERLAVEEELADVLLYLVRLADRCDVDLGAAALAKIRKNAAKYPAERCHGSSAKYTAYDGREGEQQGKEQAQQQQQREEQPQEQRS
ncbi:hypothetical protein PLESTB_000007500 [Pleodorina starrii]|uniref:dCTP pyrophosphatase 1 n=1 Tax=Pleodorina starrii TaxID=330485 RepID=A0A9W6B9L6_9CHLO|nr:hypothetical protein PLESTM_000839700 [Pleodorina starrii]GLC47617.1 hypothetical protein PLESTB_000007500 [Pleodorina starrii]GLC75625.1 hypothetical protein PLESTF_001666500 [Pleodorina starrii]